MTFFQKGFFLFLKISRNRILAFVTDRVTRTSCVHTARFRVYSGRCKIVSRTPLVVENTSHTKTTLRIHKTLHTTFFF